MFFPLLFLFYILGDHVHSASFECLCFTFTFCIFVDWLDVFLFVSVAALCCIKVRNFNYELDFHFNHGGAAFDEPFFIIRINC